MEDEEKRWRWGEEGGGNGRRGGCEAQHSVHTNSTVSKSGAAPLPDEGRGGRELGPDREVVREGGEGVGGRWTEDLKMNGKGRNAGKRREIQ